MHISQKEHFIKKSEHNYAAEITHLLMARKREREKIR